MEGGDAVLLGDAVRINADVESWSRLPPWKRLWGCKSSLRTPAYHERVPLPLRGHRTLDRKPQIIGARESQGFRRSRDRAEDRDASIEHVHARQAPLIDGALSVNRRSHGGCCANGLLSGGFKNLWGWDSTSSRVIVSRRS
jgi:hypothetical protein